MSKSVVQHSSAFSQFHFFFHLAITQLYSAGFLPLVFRSFLNDFWLGVNVQSGIMVNGIGKLFQQLHQVDIKILTSLTGCNDALTLEHSYQG